MGRVAGCPLRWDTRDPDVRQDPADTAFVILLTVGTPTGAHVLVDAAGNCSKVCKACRRDPAPTSPARPRLSYYSICIGILRCERGA